MKRTLLVNPKRKQNGLIVLRRKNAESGTTEVITPPKAKASTRKSRSGGKRGKGKKVAKAKRMAPIKIASTAPLKVVRINRRRAIARRRNTGVASGVARIPVIGGPLAQVVEIAPLAALGAVAIEPLRRIASYVAEYLPDVPATAYYAGGGLIVGALLAEYLPLQPEVRKSVGLAVASSALGVAYYRYATGADETLAGEIGALEIGAPNENVVPLGSNIYGY